MMKINSTILSLIWLLLTCGVVNNCLSAQTVIGGSTPDGSAMLDVQSINKGVLFPRMTTDQRNAISQAAFGLMIFNTTTGCLEINLGATTASWECIIRAQPIAGALDCGSRTLNNFPLFPNPAAPATPAKSFTISYTGGNGLAHSGQTVSSTGVTGLTATLLPGTSASGSGSLTYTLSGTPNTSGTASFAINIGGQTCTLNVPVTCGAYVASGVWKEFLCYNLGAVGATTGANPFTPNWELLGNYYQWGYITPAAPGPSNASTPNDGDFNSFPTGFTWNSTRAADGSWTDTPIDKGGQDPCPDGFRVPSAGQWYGVWENNSITDPAGASWAAGINNYSSGKLFGPGLFLPAAGSRDPRNPPGGELFMRGEIGWYWSSSISGSDEAWRLDFISTNPNVWPNIRLWGFSVRCIAE